MRYEADRDAVRRPPVAPEVSGATHRRGAQRPPAPGPHRPTACPAPDARAHPAAGRCRPGGAGPRRPGERHRPGGEPVHRGAGAPAVGGRAPGRRAAPQAAHRAAYPQARRPCRSAPRCPRLQPATRRPPALDTAAAGRQTRRPRDRGHGLVRNRAPHAKTTDLQPWQRKQWCLPPPPPPPAQCGLRGAAGGRARRVRPARRPLPPGGGEG